MPLITKSAYSKRPWYLPNPHLETIIPSMVNKAQAINYQRERLELSDGDFLDLDWIQEGNRRLLILCHGFGGSSQRHYIKRPAKYFHERKWDILAWNNRGCSGEINRLMKIHHHGDTDDLLAVINHSLSSGKYDQTVLLGISMGGCQTVKYFGERTIDERILGAFTVSVSCDLQETNEAVQSKLWGLYSKKFLSAFKDQFKKKAAIHKKFEEVDFDAIGSFDDFHQQITTQIYGFSNVDDLYRNSSCIHYFDKISKPVFILNAKNDPLLGPKCYPIAEAENHEFIHLETPRYGGHVGFTIPRKDYSYIEIRAEKFINEVLFR